MNALVTLAQAKVALHIADDDTTHDVDLEMKIEQASAIMLRHMKLDTVPSEWLIGSPVTVAAPPLIQSYTHLIIGELNANREASVFNIDNILRHVPRDPTLA